MPVIRNKLSSVAAGGPRQFAELQDRLLVSVSDEQKLQEVRSELDRFEFRSTPLRVAPVLTVEPRNKIGDVLERAREIGDDTPKIRNGIREVTDGDPDGDEIMEATNAVLAATGNLLRQVRSISNINIANFVRTEADYGPENLRINIQEQESLSDSEAQDSVGNLKTVYEALGIPEVWEETRGENAVYAVFDTGYSKDLISSSRIRNTFNGGGTTDVFASEEGHGTMTAGAAVANKQEGVPFDGVAPDAEVILVRITDNEGQIRSDIISQAWDWLSQLNINKPIVANHSYGTPLCSGRPRNDFCNTPLNEVIKVVNEENDVTSVYAAGNEAMRCGHRPAGFTNAITGTNSLSEVITVGALLTSGREAQRYSSHGRGDCAPIADPKPNVSCRIPMVTYYGGNDGYKMKDMGSGPFGSGGGTSHAAPTTAGMITLMQSKAAGRQGNDSSLETEEIKQIIERTAEAPRRTQINIAGLFISKKGYDARFGNGEMRVKKAMAEV